MKKEMFDPKSLKERLGPLKKNTHLDALREVEEYAVRKFKEAKLDWAYDVIAQEMPYFKTMGYTEYATNFLMQPLNLDMRTEATLDGSNDYDSEIVDYASYLRSNIENKRSNKYQDRKQDFDQYEQRDFLVVLPGSNKIKDMTCLNKLRHIKRQHHGNLYFKPHPITTHAVIGELKDFFGQDAVLDRDLDMYHFMQQAKKVYTTHISESGLYAAALGKDIEPIDVYNGIERGSFYSINKYLFVNKDNFDEWVNRTFSSPKSGIINPHIDVDWKLKIDMYMDYIMKKREYFKDWFVDGRKKK